MSLQSGGPPGAMQFFNIYQYLAPAALLPMSYWLWWLRYDRDHAVVLFVLSMPILFAYIIPGVGTNLLGLWELNTRWRLGKFRPHHGFVFGSATSLLTFVCLDRSQADIGVWEVLRAGIVLGSVLGFWNWFYDIEAIRAGFIIVYNRPFAERRGAEAIAMDYAPVLFGGFGFCFGSAIRAMEFTLLQRGDWWLYWPLVIGCNLMVLLTPVALFILGSYARNGTSGLTPLKGD